MTLQMEWKTCLFRSRESRGWDFGKDCQGLERDNLRTVVFVGARDGRKSARTQLGVQSAQRSLVSRKRVFRRVEMGS